MTTLQKHFGFTRPPFPRVPPEEAILHHKGLDEVLAKLHFALERDTIALLVAESGCGKSTALSLFARSLDASSHQLVALSLTAMAAGGKVIDATAVQQAVVDMEGLWTEQGQTGCRCRRTGADASPGRPSG